MGMKQFSKGTIAVLIDFSCQVRHEKHQSFRLASFHVRMEHRESLFVVTPDQVHVPVNRRWIQSPGPAPRLEADAAPPHSFAV